MRDSIDEWTAVLPRAAFQRPLNAYELAFDRVAYYERQTAPAEAAVVT